MNMDNGAKAVVIAAALWPSLDLVPALCWDDRHGIDAYLGTLRIQIKGDEAITQKRNLYHEIYEKTAGHPE
jgi:hypothetical protein